MLDCDLVTTNMTEEIRRTGLNFGDAEKRVHGEEAMVESHMPKPELAKVEAPELQVRLLMTSPNKVSMRYMRSGRRSGPDRMAVHPKGCGRIFMSLANSKENWSLW